MATSVSEERSTFVEALLVSLSLVSLETHCVKCGSLVGHRYSGGVMNPPFSIFFLSCYSEMGLLCPNMFVCVCVCMCAVGGQ